MKYLLYLFYILSGLTVGAQQKKKLPLRYYFWVASISITPDWMWPNSKVLIYLSPQRQQEVEDVTRMLIKFAPTKIFIEAVPSRQAQMDSLLQAYKNGAKKLSASEVEQLGFRLAKQLSLSTLYGVDYHEAAFPFDSLMKSATEAGQTGITSFVQKTIADVQQRFNEALSKSTIKEMLLRENSEGMIKFQHQFYFTLLAAGKQGNHVGSYLVSEWWRRNMVIYENILKTLNGTEEKVLVIFGSGHTAILNEMMKFNPAIQLVSAAKVFKGRKIIVVN